MPARAVTRSLRYAGVLAGVGGLVAGTAGCGSVKRFSNPNLVEGKIAFVQKCGSCHTLARAGTKGTIGPDLDDAFRAAVAGGLGRSAIEGVVHDQVLNPNPSGAMPKDLAGGKVLDDIASYVSQSAAKPGQDAGLLAEAVHKPGTGAPAVEKNGTLALMADPTGQLSYTTRKAVATPGAVTITMKNMATIGHNIAIQPGTNGPVLAAGPVVSNGGSDTLHVTLKPGSYTFFCQVPGHRAAGMFGTITVK